MQLSQMERFVQITQYNSLHTAAEKMFLSVQTLSKSIHALENELQTLLFYRSAQGITLTKDGENFLKFCLQTIEAYQNLLSHMAHETSHTPPLPKQLSGTLNIYMTPLYTNYLLPQAIRNFYCQYAQVKIATANYNSLQIADLLHTASTDEDTEMLGCLSIPYINGKAQRSFAHLHDNILLHPLKLCRYVCCVSPKSPYAHNKSISVKHLLQKEKIISLVSYTAENTPLDYCLKQYGTPQYILSTAAAAIYLEAVSNNVGIGLINEATLDSEPYLKAHKNEMAYLRLSQPLQVLCCAGYRSDKHHLIDHFLPFLPSAATEIE